MKPLYEKLDGTIKNFKEMDRTNRKQYPSGAFSQEVISGLRRHAARTRVENSEKAHGAPHHSKTGEEQQEILQKKNARLLYIGYG